MKNPLIFCLFLPLLATAQESAWESRQLLPHFHAEGAAVGDLNGDGEADIAYGPFWFAGPGFEKPIRFAEGEAFVAEKGYSDNFFSYLTDANEDGRNDILVYGFPGKEARLYLNPGKTKPGGNWAMHIIANEISNESPTFVDLVPGGLPEMVCTANTEYGYYEAGDDPTQPWSWNAISKTGEAGGRFEHGLGVGDVNGDGHLDIVQRQFWYENPGAADPSAAWEKHGWAPMASAGGAQILVNDLDGDGDSDLISSLRAHGFGLAWFEQVEPGKFARHDLMGESSTDSPYGVCFSQLHALALADMDGDGRMDFVTGKRYLAHQGKDPGGLQEPVLYWFRNTKTDEGIDFVPHLVHRDSGVGVEITVADLNADGKPDIITGNKKGLTIHRQKDGAKPIAIEPWKVPGGRPQDNYGENLSPQESLARIEAPPGFSVDLIAAEPELTQPIAMCFDARGRIWVIEGHTYPVPAPEGEGKDRILIFEDSDADGSFETRKVFAEGINLASGIEVGFGGVFVGAAPQFLFFPDADGDDVPDREPEVLLDGWGHQDTHETLNAFTWGPDGWLYGCHGIFTHSKVGKPGTPEEERTKINAGVWRFHPVTRKFEVYAHGSSNPWGVDFNEYGDWFISACVIPHFYHLSQGGRYQRQAGQHFNPWTFDDIKTIADHAHYTGNLRDHAFWGVNKENRPPSPSDTSALGGGHAHCGLAIYSAEEFPDAYRGDAFFHNLHGHRLVRERLERDGSGYIARHRPDFVFSNNHDHIGVGVMQGPDGALYYSDWVDAQTCHHRDVEIWDRSNGRLFRVRHGEAKTTVTGLTEMNDSELVALLAHTNSFHARQAQRLLQERAAGGSLDRKAVRSALKKFENKNAHNTSLRLRAFWTAQVCGLHSTSDLISRLSDPSEHVRGWAVQFLGEPEEPLSAEALASLEKLAAEEFSLITRRYLASLLQRLPLEQRWQVAEGLIGHHRSVNDRNLQLLCWYGIEPLIELDGARALSLAGKTTWPQLREFISRRGAITPQGREAIMTSLSKAKSPEEFLQRSNQLLTALSKLPPVEGPKAWPQARERGEALAAKNPPIADALSRLGVRFGDPAFFPKWRAIARDQKAKAADRLKAIDLLTAGKDPELGGLAREVLATPSLRPAAIAALRLAPGPETAEALVSRIGGFPLKLRNETINLLASRPEMALTLLRAVDSGKVETSLISPVMLDQFERFQNEEINALIANNWVRGGGGVDLAELSQKIGEWKQKLNPQVMAKADASRGRQVFTVTCGTCHQLFGEGIALGPDLTGSNRSDMAYLLENALAPSSVVAKEYMLQVFNLKDGSTISGMVREEGPEFIKVGMPGGSMTDLKVADIDTRDRLAQSLMPPGLFESLPLNQVADLVAYLSSPNQVPFPGEAQASAEKPSDVPAPPDGVIRIEGEALVAGLTPAHGQVKTQGMASFGPGWSGNQHLWWIGAKPGNSLTLKLNSLKPGTHDLALFPTTARDYGKIKVTINGQLKEADLYSETVLPGEPLSFRKVTVNSREPLQIDIHLTGKNDAAIPRFMVGIDRIELSPAK